ncbi:hypothetical protein ABIE89_000121 [Bradyrhizobium niftali]
MHVTSAEPAPPALGRKQFAPSTGARANLNDETLLQPALPK